MEAPFCHLPTLETARLVLRPLTLADADAVFAYASDPEVAYYTGFYPHVTVEDSRGFLRNVLGRYAANLPASWGLVDAESGVLIGAAGFVAWDAGHQSAELGYVLARPSWGQGLMSEAVAAMLSFGFETQGLNRVEALVKAPNTGSARVLEKAGMRLEGEMRAYRWKHGRPFDYRLYALLASEWRERCAPGGRV